MVHVGQVAETETLDILFQCDSFFDIIVLGDIVGPDGVVDNNAVYGRVIVGGSNVLLEALFLYSAQVEVKATIGEASRESAVVQERLGGQREYEGRGDSLLHACLLRPFCVLDGGGVVVGQERSETGLAIADGLKGLLDLLEKAFSDGVGKNDLAGLGNGGHDDGVGAE